MTITTIQEQLIRLRNHREILMKVMADHDWKPNPADNYDPFRFGSRDWVDAAAEYWQLKGFCTVVSRDTEIQAWRLEIFKPEVVNALP